MQLKGRGELESSPVVANSSMNRERQLSGPNSYGKDLNVDVLDLLLARAQVAQPAAWLDLCCGSGRALLQAVEELARRGDGQQATIVGVDLVPFFCSLDPGASEPRLLTANLETWSPDQAFDLITCVHGLHYVGDKLGLLRRAAGWLRPGGILLAHLDLANVRLEQGASAARRVTAAFRRAGAVYDGRRKIVRLDGPRELDFALDYVGADDAAGPNFTGQPAVNSVYRSA